MEVPAIEGKQPQSAETCSHCGANEREEGFELPLCVQCRDLLSRRAFPMWVKVSWVIVLGISVFAGVRSINSFRAGISFERGKKAEEHGQFAIAADYYEQVVERFPDSTLALARLGITRFYAGQSEEAARILNRLNGRETSPQLAAEVNQVIQAIQNKRLRTPNK